MNAVTQSKRDAIMVLMNHKVSMEHISFSIRFEPMQFTWLTSREQISYQFTQLIGRSITSIEITENLLSCSEFINRMKDAYRYCMEYPSHSYFGMCGMSCIDDGLDNEFMFTASAHLLPSGITTYEIEVRLGTVASAIHTSKEYEDCLKVRIMEECEQIRKRLSKRECQVITMLSSGLTVKESAAQLYLSTHTVESHKQNIYHKLGIRTMAELGKMAERLGLTK